MALKTQFKGWNRNQPLVIYAKEKYDQLMDDYQLISRYTIINMTLCIIFTIITTTFVFILYIDPVAAFASILPTVFCWIYTRRVVHHTIGSPVNKEIDEIAKMEQDDILKLNMEKIDNIIYSMAKLEGETDCYINHVRTIPIFVMLFSLVVYTITMIGGIMQW